MSTYILFLSLKVIKKYYYVIWNKGFKRLLCVDNSSQNSFLTTQTASTNETSISQKFPHQIRVRLMILWMFSAHHFIGISFISKRSVPLYFFFHHLLRNRKVFPFLSLWDSFHEQQFSKLSTRIPFIPKETSRSKKVELKYER